MRKLLGFIIAVFLISLALTCEVESASKSTKERAVLKIITSLPDSNAYINGEYLGKTPVTITSEVPIEGKIVVEKVANGKIYYAEKAVKVFPGETKEVNLAMNLGEVQIIWQKALGGSWNDGALSVQQTKDGGYVIAGWTTSNDGDVSGNHGWYDAWVVKLGAKGNIQWQRVFGGSDYDTANSIRQTTDGGYIVAGITMSNDKDVSGNHGSLDIWVLKLDEHGNIQWKKTLGGSYADQAFSVLQTKDGGYLVAGTTESLDGDVSKNHGKNDAWLIKLDGRGNIQWQKTYGGSGYDHALSIQQTTDGGYIMAGLTTSNDGDVSGNHGGCDIWLVKLDEHGNIQWQRTLGGSKDEGTWILDNALELVSIQQTKDGGYIVAGWTESNDGDVKGNHGLTDAWVVKLSSNGKVEWQKTLGGSGYDAAYSVQQTKDGGYIVAGYTSSSDGDVPKNSGRENFWIVKLDSMGNIEWQKVCGGSGWDIAFSIQQTKDGGYIVAGATMSSDGDVFRAHGYIDLWVVKLQVITQAILKVFSDSPGADVYLNGEHLGKTPLTIVREKPIKGKIVLKKRTENKVLYYAERDVYAPLRKVNIVDLSLRPIWIEWQKVLGGSEDDQALSVRPTSDGGYIAAGWTRSNDGDVSGNYGEDDVWVVKFDSSGRMLWQRVLGGSNYDGAYSVLETKDGGYIVAGYTWSNDGDVIKNHEGSDVWLIKLDRNGNILWQKTLGGSGNEGAYSIQPTRDGGFILAGHTTSNDGDVSGFHGEEYWGDFWVVKLDANGNIQWQKCLGGSEGEEARSIRQTSDGGYIVVGISWSSDGDLDESHGKNKEWQDIWVVKLDSKGNIQWSRIFGGSLWDIAFDVKQTMDGGYIIAGLTLSNDGDVTKCWGGYHMGDAWIIKLDSKGNLQWQKTYGGSDDDAAFSILQTGDGGYIVGGFTSSEDGDVRTDRMPTEEDYGGNIWILKLDAHGNIIWQEMIGGTGLDRINSIQKTPDGGYIAAGWTDSYDGDVPEGHDRFDFWVLKFFVPSEKE